MTDAGKARRRNLVIVSAALAAAIAVFFISSEFLHRTPVPEISDVAFDDLPDGSYPGSYNAGQGEYRVIVRLSEGAISEVIPLSLPQTAEAKRAEAVLRRVIEQQQVDVEPIEEARQESLALLKAVEQALRDARQDR
jgi:uncharacterized protein with FMN-binding domain